MPANLVFRMVQGEKERRWKEKWIDSPHETIRVREVGASALKKLKEFDYSRGNFRDLENMLRNACRQAVRDGRTYLVEKDVTSAFQ